MWSCQRVLNYPVEVDNFYINIGLNINSIISHIISIYLFLIMSINIPSTTALQNTPWKIPHSAMLS